jgi:hypothetical protein
MPCYIERMEDGGTRFLCGNFGPHCAAEKFRDSGRVIAELENVVPFRGA